MGRGKPEPHPHSFGKRDCVMVRDQHTAARDNDQAANGRPEQNGDKELPAVTKISKRRVRAAIGISRHTLFCAQARCTRKACAWPGRKRSSTLGVWFAHNRNGQPFTKTPNLARALADMHECSSGPGPIVFRHQNDALEATPSCDLSPSTKDRCLAACSQLAAWITRLLLRVAIGDSAAESHKSLRGVIRGLIPPTLIADDLHITRGCSGMHLSVQRGLNLRNTIR